MSPMSPDKLLLGTEGPILFIKVYPFVSPSFLIAVGLGSNVAIYECLELEKDGSMGEVNCMAIIKTATRLRDMYWSPETSLLSEPRIIKFFTSDSSHMIRGFTSDLKESTTNIFVGEHQSFINSIAVHPEKEDCLASVGDDNFCHIWAAQKIFKKQYSFALTSPGMKVSWHPKEPSKLMVAEKSGLIRFYSTEMKQAFMSLDCGHTPLLSAHWSLVNPLHVAAVVGTDVFIFNTSQSSQPVLTQKIHSSGGTDVMWCPSNEQVLVTVGGPRFQIQLLNVANLKTTTLREYMSFTGMDTHPTLPLLFVASDNEIRTCSTAF